MSLPEFFVVDQGAGAYDQGRNLRLYDNLAVWDGPDREHRFPLDRPAEEQGDSVVIVPSVCGFRWRLRPVRAGDSRWLGLDVGAALPAIEARLRAAWDWPN